MTVVSVVTHEKGDPIVHSGLRAGMRAYRAAEHAHNPLGGPVAQAFIVVDMPLSFIFETALLPVTGPLALYDIYFDSANLALCAARGDINGVRRASRQRFIDLNAADRGGRTAVHLAVLPRGRGDLPVPLGGDRSLPSRDSLARCGRFP